MSNLLALNDRIFAELDRLEQAEGEELEREIERAKAISSMCGRAIENANTILRAVQAREDAMDDAAMRIGTTRLLVGAQPVTVEVEQ